MITACTSDSCCRVSQSAHRFANVMTSSGSTYPRVCCVLLYSVVMTLLEVFPCGDERSECRAVPDARHSVSFMSKRLSESRTVFKLERYCSTVSVDRKKRCSKGVGSSVPSIVSIPVATLVGTRQRISAALEFADGAKGIGNGVHRRIQEERRSWPSEATLSHETVRMLERRTHAWLTKVGLSSKTMRTTDLRPS